MATNKPHDAAANFATAFESQDILNNLKPGTLLDAEVISFLPSEANPEMVKVNVGLKTEPNIEAQEFKGADGKLIVKPGDVVKVVLLKFVDNNGDTVVSYAQAKLLETWQRLEHARADNKNVQGTIVESVRGGFIVELGGGTKGFLPASLVDIRPVKDSSYLKGKELDFKIVKLEKPNNIVVSRRAALLEEGNIEREAVLTALQEGQEVIGVVKNITDYGAFIDLGGVDGLLHITDISWRRIKHPGEVLKVGEEVRVKVLKFDREKNNRVSLGLKQLSEDPWFGVERRYPVGTRLFGKVTNITDYGCFVELEKGIEGLVHMSEMDWTNKNIHPSKIVNLDSEVEVMVLEVSEERRRISLGIKQCHSNPWEDFAANHKKGDKIQGKIKSITDFGVFIGLDGNIDGLVHLSDLDWNEPGEKVIRNFKKGQDVEAVILAMDSERERISLGIKQLAEDVYETFYAAHPKGTLVNGKVTEVTPKNVTINLAPGIDGRMKASDITKNAHIKDATEIFSVGDEIQVAILSYDKKTRVFNVATKTLLDNQSEGPSGTALGDLLKEQMAKAAAAEKPQEEEVAVSSSESEEVEQTEPEKEDHEKPEGE